jgi:hypothetical protein
MLMKDISGDVSENTKFENQLMSMPSEKIINDPNQHQSLCRICLADCESY